MTKTFGELDASIQAKLEADADFQSTVADLSEEERSTRFNEKKQELLDLEIASLHDKAEKATKAEELANNYKIRAEKAESDAKKKGEGEAPKSSQETAISPKDMLALTENKVSSDDFDEVVRIATILNKPIHEALKDSTLKTILTNREEERTTAMATQTRSPRGVQKESGDALIAKAQKGQLDESEIDKLVEAQLAQKSKR
jgi:heme oxygenase